MGPTNNLLYLLQHVAAVINKQSEQQLQEDVGIGNSQYKILCILEWNPRVAQKTIAKNLGQTEASISRQIKLLIKKGLLTSERDPKKHSKHVIVPTQRGMQTTEMANGVMRRSLGPDIEDFGEVSHQELITNLKKLHYIICSRGKAGSCNHPLGL